MLQARGISLHIDGKSILESVDLKLEAGELLGLIGPNGAGKSTLLRMLAGLPGLATGSIQLNGKELLQMGAKERARNIAYLAQDHQVHWPLMVERLVELGRLPHLGSWQRPTDIDMQIINRVMQQTDVEQLRQRVFDTLSGGEAMRVLLARALAGEPTILLTDEPVAALDPAHQLDVMQLLQHHCRSGGAAVVVLHDLALASHFCDRLQLLHSGRTVAVGTPATVLTEDNLRDVYGIRVNPDFTATTEAFSLPVREL
ncbi:MAG: ABC transporter ATP-binding protein [Gammaproteobacteria bacterium]